MSSSAPIHIIGGGLAGSEAAWQIVSCGIPVVLHEMRPVRETAAHKTAALHQRYGRLLSSAWNPSWSPYSNGRHTQMAVCG